jgi:hypothetical protein
MSTRTHKLQFRDGVEFDVDLLEALLTANRQLRFVIAEMERQRARGRDTAHKNVLAKNDVRDCEIAGDELFFRLAINRRDCGELHALLAECQVPKAKWATFKPVNVTAALAKKHGLSKPAIGTILKNWKARYGTF